MMEKKSQFSSRLLLLAGVLGVWFLLIPGRILFLVGPARTATILKGEELAHQSGLIPAIRGRIITKDGQVLAWNERFLDLEVSWPFSEKTRCFLAAEFPGKSFGPEENICKGLSPDKFSRLRKSVAKYPELKIVPRVERVYIPDVRLLPLIGSCEWKDGRLVGVSGLEKTHEKILAGEHGQYEVMLDRYRNWIKRSLRLIRKPRNGQDLYLKQSLAELVAAGGEK